MSYKMNHNYTIVYEYEKKPMVWSGYASDPITAYNDWVNSFSTEAARNNTVEMFRSIIDMTSSVRDKLEMNVRKTPPKKSTADAYVELNTANDLTMQVTEVKAKYLNDNNVQEASK